MSYDLWKTRDPNDTGFYDMPDDRLQEAKRAALKIADERAIEANGLRQSEADLRYEAGMYQSLYELSESKLARARKALEEVETRLEGPFNAQLYDIGLIVRAALTDEQGK